jgi:hypothetical protein
LHAWAERHAGHEEAPFTIANARTGDLALHVDEGRLRERDEIYATFQELGESRLSRGWPAGRHRPAAPTALPSPSGNLAADAAGLCRYLCAAHAGRRAQSGAPSREIDDAVARALPLMSRVMDAFETTATLRTSDSIGYLLRAVAIFHRLGLESMEPEAAERIASWLSPLLAELHELQLGSPVYDFHHGPFLPVHRGAIRRSHLDERIDALASMRCLAALLSLQHDP